MLLGMDLVGTIESYRVPLDDPLELLLDRPRGTGTTHLGDDLWVRPLDPAALLAARTLRHRHRLRARGARRRVG